MLLTVYTESSFHWQIVPLPEHCATCILTCLTAYARRRYFGSSVIHFFPCFVAEWYIQGGLGERCMLLQTVFATLWPQKKAIRGRNLSYLSWSLTQNNSLIVVVVVIAQQLFSYRQLSRLRKSATAAGLSHRSCTVSCVRWLWQLNRCSTECGATPHSGQTSDMPLVMQAL